MRRVHLGGYRCRGAAALLIVVTIQFDRLLRDGNLAQNPLLPISESMVRIDSPIVEEHEDTLLKKISVTAWNNTNQTIPAAIVTITSRTATQTAPPLPCRMLITNRFLASHVEVLESIVRRFPLPWHKLTGNVEGNPSSSDNCGKTAIEPIKVDIYLAQLQRDPTKSFSVGWKSYFETHLKKSFSIASRQRAVDGRYFLYNAVVEQIPTPNDDHETNNDDDDNSYNYTVTIEATCDGQRGFAQQWLHGAPDRFCVLHGPGFNGDEIPIDLLPRTCHLNSYDNDTCWFLPTDFPTFEKKKLQQKQLLLVAKNHRTGSTTTKENTPAATLRLCTPGKMGINLLSSALKELPPGDEKNIQIMMYGGRYDKMWKVFRRHRVEHYLMPPDANRYNYTAFHESISQCDGMISLIRPDSRHYHHYFKGTLTGSMALTVRHSLPVLLQSNFSTIYQSQLTTAW